MNILVVNALNGMLPLALRDRYPDAKITCAEVFSTFKGHLARLGFEVIDWEAIDMKFDVVVGNPPYQAPGTQGKKLWKEFFVQSMNLLNENGIMTLLTPSSYVRRTGQKMERIREVVENNTVHWLDMDATNHFNVGEEICAIVVQKGKHPALTKVKFGGKVEIQNLSGKFNPTFGKTDILTKSILDKVRYSPLPKLAIREDINNSQAKLLAEGKLSKVKDLMYQYPVIYTPNTIHYSKTLFGDCDKLKLMLTVAGTYYTDSNSNRNIFVTRAHSGQGMCHILIESEQDGACIKSFLTSKLFRFYIESEKTSGYNTGLKHLPNLGMSKIWTDQEIYDHFQLTEEEQLLVEQTIGTD